MRDNDNPIYQVISSKVIDWAELVIILFEHCNLKCIMCPQDHDSFENTSRKDILSKADIAAAWINDNNSKSFRLHIMGGEVFEDRFVSDNYLDIYQEFISTVKSKVIDKEKELVFNFVTNLVFTKKEEVYKFLEKNNLKISTSYDSSGRFSKKDLELFKQNIEYFEDRIEMVSCVMTAPSMKAVVNGDTYFDYLYNKFSIDFDSLWPTGEDNINRFLMPTESEALEFYKHLVDNYPKCLNVEHFVTDKPTMKMTCTRGNNTTILQDNTVPKGCSGSAYVVDRKTSDDDVSEVMTNFFEKYDCFTCEFFSRCPFTCFIKADYKYIEDDLNDCVFRKTFQHVKEKNLLHSN